MPRRAAERPAAYTRTRHLDRFMDQVADALPGTVDGEYVGRRLGLSGGDVRAFLQSLRVLGLIDTFGHPTAQLRQGRARERRDEVLREGLRGAYPELVARWEAGGGLTREEVADHFRVVYGLATTSAEPAAKLFVDLWGRAEGGQDRRTSGLYQSEELLEKSEASSKGGEVRAPQANAVPRKPRLEDPGERSVAVGVPRRESLAHLLAGLVHIEIGRDWDAERINLVFDRLERLLDRLESSDLTP